MRKDIQFRDMDLVQELAAMGGVANEELFKLADTEHHGRVKHHASAPHVDPLALRCKPVRGAPVG